MTSIVTLRKTTREALAIVGQKAVSLGILSQKFPVPPAFIITAAAFQSFLERTGIAKKAETLLAAANTPEKIMQASRTIQHLITSVSLPDYFSDELLDAYYSLNIEEQHSLQDLMEQGEEPFVAVRPSPVSYDGTGLHQSSLNIKGMPELEKALQECWASFYSQEAIEYRQQQEKKEKMHFAVIIQKMIGSNAAGMMETSYKMNREEVLILGCKGLGTALATGQIVPDKYFITKKTLNIALIEPGKQPFFFERDVDTHKTTKVYLQEEYSKKQKITDRHIGELTLYAKKIEEIFGKPQVIDFAIEKDCIYFLGAAEPEWLSEQFQKEQEQMQKNKNTVPEQTSEQLQQKEEEISVGLTKELQEDTYIARALTGATGDVHSMIMQGEESAAQNITAEEKQHVVESEQRESIAPMKSNDPHDINNIIQSIDFNEMLAEVEHSATAVGMTTQATSFQSLSSLVFPGQQKAGAITEEVAETAASEEQSEMGIVAEVSKKELTQLEKAAGNLVVHCFKEVKAKVPKEQWSTSPVLRHLAVLAQNFSQKNVAPTPSQVKFALDAVEKMGE